LELSLYRLDSGIYSFSTYGPLLARSTKSTSNLLSIEHFAPAILLNNSGQRQLNTLIGREAIATILTLAATANRPTITA
jgi:hypothetical protein